MLLLLFVFLLIFLLMGIDTGRTQVTVSKQQLGAGSGKLTREQSSSKAASGKNLAVHLKTSTIHSETFPNGALTLAVPERSALGGA